MPGRSLDEFQDSVTSPERASQSVVLIDGSRRQTVWWVIAISLAVIATALINRWDGTWLSRAALAQAGFSGGAPSAGARGIYAFTGQLGAKDYGLFMLDVDTGTVWCYEMARSRDGQLQLQLVAARSWIFDRFLEEFNVAKPTPSEVQLMVRQQRGNAGAAGNLMAPANAPFNLPATQPSGAFAPALPSP
jgi:hypothetical protein